MTQSYTQANKLLWPLGLSDFYIYTQGGVLALEKFPIVMQNFHNRKSLIKKLPKNNNV